MVKAREVSVLGKKRLRAIESLEVHLMVQVELKEVEKMLSGEVPHAPAWTFRSLTSLDVCATHVFAPLHQFIFL